MSSNVVCPDCKSQDIQEKIKTYQVTTSGKNWKWFWLILIGGILITILGVSLTGFDVFFIFLILSIPASIFILNTGTSKNESVATTQHICRSCGREF